MTPPRKEPRTPPIDIEFSVPQLKRHELSRLFPDMTPEEFSRLKDDIQEQGLLQPVVIFRNRILDGWHRYRACLELGISCTLSEFHGDDALKFVVSSNLHRRQLTDSQRAMVAAEIANLKNGSNQFQTKGPPIGGASTAEAAVPIAAAATMVNAKPRSAERAAAVRNKGVAELCQSVKDGEVTVGAAEQIARLPEAEQHEIVAAGPAAMREKAAAMRKPEPVAEYAPSETPPGNAPIKRADCRPTEGMRIFQQTCATFDRVSKDDNEFLQAARALVAYAEEKLAKALKK